jgi:hypothetical protein
MRDALEDEGWHPLETKRPRLSWRTRSDEVTCPSVATSES